jgi:hypothetical protein
MTPSELIDGKSNTRYGPKLSTEVVIGPPLPVKIPVLPSR